MNKPTKLRRTQERQYSAHHMLIETARRANERVIREEIGWTYDALCSITFSALAVEALANAFGERKVEGWSDIESASPIAKLRILALTLGLKYESDIEPWRTVRWLIKVRNLVAHAKPQLIREEHLLTQEEVDRRLFDRPESKIERELTKGNSERAVRAASALKDLLCASISLEEAMGLITDGWSGFTSLQE
jgi:hypothetical protein